MDKHLYYVEFEARDTEKDYYVLAESFDKAKALATAQRIADMHIAKSYIASEDNPYLTVARITYLGNLLQD